MERSIYNRKHSICESHSRRKDMGVVLEISADDPLDDHLFGSKPRDTVFE
jgi:hypothetical protein